MRGPVPRATVKKRLPFHVGRGPVPRHAAVYRKIAGETRSDARMASEGPRARVIVAAVPRRGYRVRRDSGDRPPRDGDASASRPGGLSYGEDASNIKRLKRISNTQAPGITLFVFT